MQSSSRGSKRLAPAPTAKSAEKVVIVQEPQSNDSTSAKRVHRRVSPRKRLTRRKGSRAQSHASSTKDSDSWTRTVFQNAGGPSTKSSKKSIPADGSSKTLQNASQLNVKPKKLRGCINIIRTKHVSMLQLPATSTKSPASAITDASTSSDSRLSPEPSDTTPQSTEGRDSKSKRYALT